MQRISLEVFHFGKNNKSREKLHWIKVRFSGNFQFPVIRSRPEVKNMTLQSQLYIPSKFHRNQSMGVRDLATSDLKCTP